LVYAAENEHEVVEVAEALDGLRETFQNNMAIVAQGPLLLVAEVLVLLLHKSSPIKMRVFINVPAAEAYCREGKLSGLRDDHHCLAMA